MARQLSLTKTIELEGMAAVYLAAAICEVLEMPVLKPVPARTILTRALKWVGVPVPERKLG